MESTLGGLRCTYLFQSLSVYAPVCFSLLSRLLAPFSVFRGVDFFIPWPCNDPIAFSFLVPLLYPFTRASSATSFCSSLLLHLSSYFHFRCPPFSFSSFSFSLFSYSPGFPTSIRSAFLNHKSCTSYLFTLYCHLFSTPRSLLPALSFFFILTFFFSLFPPPSFPFPFPFLFFSFHYS